MPTGRSGASGTPTLRPGWPGARRSIVGIAADTATGGYWLVSSHGAIYSFGAPFLGSVPAGTTETAIAGIQAEPGGGGYRLVDGGRGVVLLRDGHPAGFGEHRSPVPCRRRDRRTLTRLPWRWGPGGANLAVPYVE